MTFRSRGNSCHVATAMRPLMTCETLTERDKTMTTKKTKASTKAASKKPRTTKTNGKLSQLDAAVKVLTEVGEPMTTKAMVEAMATKGYWTSSGGKTPHATLYSALLREIHNKGKESRFVKVDRGQFGLNK